MTTSANGFSTTSLSLSELQHPHTLNSNNTNHLLADDNGHAPDPLWSGQVTIFEMDDLPLPQVPRDRSTGLGEISSEHGNVDPSLEDQEGSQPRQSPEPSQPTCSRCYQPLSNKTEEDHACQAIPISRPSRVTAVRSFYSYPPRKLAGPYLRAEDDTVLLANEPAFREGGDPESATRFPLS